MRPARPFFEFETPGLDRHSTAIGKGCMKKYLNVHLRLLFTCLKGIDVDSKLLMNVI